MIAGRAADERRLQPEQIVGRTRWEIVASEVSEAHRRAHDTAVAARLPFSDIEMTRHNLGEEPAVVSVSGEPIFDEEGRFRGYRGIARDITLRKRAEREIEDARRFLDALIDAFPTPILVKDAQHRYVAANSAFARFFRRGLPDILGKNDFDFFSAEDATYFQETDRRTLEGAGPVEYERPYPIDGQITWMLVRKTGLTRPDGSRVVVLLLLDVTARKAAEERLRASEQRFRGLTQLSVDWYWEQDTQLRFTYVSAGSNGNAKVPEDDMLGKSRFELDLEWESEAMCQEHMATLLARRPFRDLLVRHRPSGQWVTVSGEPIFDARGEFTGYRGVGRDVSRQKEAERALAESGKFLDALISAIPTPVTVKDREHRYVHVNDAFCQLAGRAREELVGHDDSLILPPGEVEFVWKLDLESLTSDKPVQYEHSYLLNGQLRWMLVRKYTLPRPDGSLVVVSSLIDISNLKAVEAALRGSEARLRSLLDLSADWMWEQDANHRYTYLSAEAPSKGGIDPEAALGKTLLELPFRWEARGAQRQSRAGPGAAPHLPRPAPDAAGSGRPHASHLGERRAHLRRTRRVPRLPRHRPGHHRAQADRAPHRAAQGHVRGDDGGQRRHHPQQGHRPAVPRHLPDRGGVRPLRVRPHRHDRLSDRVGAHGRLRRRAQGLHGALHGVRRRRPARGPGALRPRYPHRLQLHLQRHHRRSAQPALARDPRRPGRARAGDLPAAPGRPGGRHAAPVRRPGRVLRRRADRHAGEARH